MRAILFSALMLFSFSTAVFSETFSICCQLQAGGGYGVNETAEKYHSAVSRDITDAGFVTVSEGRSAKTDLNLNYTIRAMDRYFGAGLSTGLMYYTGSDYIGYRKTSDSALFSPAKYSNTFIILPETILAICSIPLSQNLNITAAAGPGLFILINSSTKKVSSNQNKADYRLQGSAAKTETLYRAGAGSFIEMSYEFAADYSYQAGAAFNLISRRGGFQSCCNMYLGMMMRTDFALHL